nr:aldehyde dehydrogenase family protein [Rhizobium leguminosarum]
MKLNDPSLFRQACPIADRWIEAEGRKAATVHNPATGEPLGVVPDLGAVETEDAIRAAVIAQKLWAKKTAGERAAVLKAWRRRHRRCGRSMRWSSRLRRRREAAAAARLPSTTPSHPS